MKLHRVNPTRHDNGYAAYVHDVWWYTRHSISALFFMRIPCHDIILISSYEGQSTIWASAALLMFVVKVCEPASFTVWELRGVTHLFQGWQWYQHCLACSDICLVGGVVMRWHATVHADVNANCLTIHSTCMKPNIDCILHIGWFCIKSRLALFQWDVVYYLFIQSCFVLYWDSNQFCVNYSVHHASFVQTITVHNPLYSALSVNHEVL